MTDFGTHEIEDWITDELAGNDDLLNVLESMLGHLANQSGEATRPDHAEGGECTLTNMWGVPVTVEEARQYLEERAADERQDAIREHVETGTEDKARELNNGCHCIRCGIEYETASRPQCECAGDPPVDKSSLEYEGYLAQVRQLRWDR